MLDKYKDDLKSIVWKYAYGRRTRIGEVIDTILELLAFVYKNRASYPDSLVLNRLGAGYIPGILSTEDESFLLNNYRELVDMCCTPSENGVTPKSRVEAIQPFEITDFAASLLKLFPGANVYNPFCGYASYALAAKDFHFSGEEINPSTWAIAQIRLDAYGINANIECGDSLKHIKEKSEECFDGIIFTPPFALREMSEMETAENLTRKLSYNGVMVFITSMGALYKPGREKDSRIRLVENMFIESVIELPNSLFYTTSVSVAAIVLSKKERKLVRFFDCSSAFRKSPAKGSGKILDRELLDRIISGTEGADLCAQASLEDIANNDYSLLPKRYIDVLPEGVPSVKLGDICSFAEPQDLILGKEKRNYLGYSSVQGLSSSYPISSIRVQPSVSKLPINRRYVIDKPAIVMRANYNEPNTPVRIGYVDEKSGFPVILSDRFYLALQVTSPLVSMQYVMTQLLTDYFQKQVYGLGGTTLRAEDVASLRIPLYPKEEQDRLVREAIEAELSDVERQREKEAESYRKGVHTRKHALSQSVSALSSRWNKLRSFAGKRETIGMKDLIPGINRLTVAEQMDLIDNLITSIIQQVDNLAEVKVGSKNLEHIQPASYLADYLRRFQSNLYLPVLEFKDVERLSDTFSFPKAVLDQIIQNIVSNAEEYGFHRKETPGNSIRFCAYRDDADIIIEVSNNGDALPGDIDPDIVFTPGFSTMLNQNQHAGIGGAEIRSLMTQFGGSVELISTPEEEYTVTYRLRFKGDENE